MSSSLIAEFCVRLSGGLACMMLITPARAVGVQFFRTVTLVVLGLSVIAALFGRAVFPWPGAMLAAASVLAFIGSVVWTLGRISAAQIVTGLLGAALFAVLFGSSYSAWSAGRPADAAMAAADAAGSAWLLGSVVAAMLLGHSYLIAPAMSIEPLQRLVGCMAGSIAARVLVELGGWCWAADRAAVSGDGIRGLLWAARWVIGLAGPAALCWMAWQTTRIRATQSATGILYAAVVLVFFGELLGELLRRPG